MFSCVASSLVSECGGVGREATSVAVGKTTLTGLVGWTGISRDAVKGSEPKTISGNMADMHSNSISLGPSSSAIMANGEFVSRTGGVGMETWVEGREASGLADI